MMMINYWYGGVVSFLETKTKNMCIPPGHYMKGVKVGKYLKSLYDKDTKRYVPTVEYIKGLYQGLFYVSL